MKARNVLLAGAAAGVAVGAVAWAAARKAREVAEVEPVMIGDRFPSVQGRTLAGNTLAVPDDLQGRPSVLILANRFNARMQVEAWVNHLMIAFGDRQDMNFLEMPLVGGAGIVMQRMIDRAMQRGTPQAMHSHVVTIYGDLRVLEKCLGMNTRPSAHVFILDRDGAIIWRTEGMPTTAVMDSFDATVRDQLAGGLPPMDDEGAQAM